MHYLPIYVEKARKVLTIVVFQWVHLNGFSTYAVQRPCCMLANLLVMTKWTFLTL